MKDKKAPDGSGGEGDEEIRPASLVSFFRYADALDMLLMFIGSIASIVLGAIQPLSLVPFADSIDTLGRADFAQEQDQVVEQIRPVLFLFLYVGLAAFVTGVLGSFCFKVAGERQAHRWRCVPHPCRQGRGEGGGEEGGVANVSSWPRSPAGAPSWKAWSDKTLPGMTRGPPRAWRASSKRPPR